MNPLLLQLQAQTCEAHGAAFDFGAAPLPPGVALDAARSLADPGTPP